jgi:hypothetical protein
MKNLNLLGLALVVVILLASCGNNSIKEKTIKANSISISGDGKDYIKVVDGDYILKVVEAKVAISIKLELNKKYDGEKQPEMGNLALIPLDKSGSAVPDLGDSFLPMNEWDKIKDLLKGDVGKQITISFVCGHYFSDKDMLKRIMKETENFEIRFADITGSSSSESNTNSNNALASSTDCDQFIKDYETFVDGYVKILKKYKINQTDPTILNEYTEVLQKATEMQTNAANCSDPKYSSKLMALATKMTKAAAELQ